MISILRFALILSVFNFINSNTNAQTGDSKTKSELLSGKWYVVAMGDGSSKVKFEAARTKKNWVMFKDDGTFTSLEDGMPNKGVWTFTSAQEITTTDTDGVTVIGLSFSETEQMTFRIYEGQNEYTYMYFKKDVPR
jgi:hypothetical protein